MNIGVDLGGSKTAVALLTNENKIVKKIILPTSRNPLDNLFKAIYSIWSPKASFIGIGVAGLLDERKTNVIISVNARGLERVELKSIVEKKFKARTMLENDAACFLKGELNERKTTGTSIAFTLGTGVGFAYCIDGRVHSSEFGHSVIDGAKTIEDYCSGKAMEKLFLKKTSRRKTAKEIVVLAKKGDAKAVETLAFVGEKFGVALANAVNEFKPAMVIIGGGASAAWPFMKKNALQELKKNAKLLSKRLKVRIGKSDSALIGAALLNQVKKRA